MILRFASGDQFVQPSNGHGKLIWHSLGAKTLEPIQQNVHVNVKRGDLDKLVLNADLLEAALSERLYALQDRFWSGVLNSVEFIKQLLQLAKEVLQAEKEVPPEEDEDCEKAALTEHFNEVKAARSNAWWRTLMQVSRQLVAANDW
jgi:type I restriction enzyme, R subunit